MRPPQESWQLAADAARALLRAVEELEQRPGSGRRALDDARKAVEKFVEFVESSEECEQP